MDSHCRSENLLLLFYALAYRQAVDAGASAYYRIENVVDELDFGDIIEIGSDRGESSTAFFSALANKTGRAFYSIDFSNEGYTNAQKVCGRCAQQSMGETWLEAYAHNASHKIALAYLDNYDWTYPWTSQMAYKLQQHVDYGHQGLSLSNERSQAAHLAQAEWVERLCTEQCFVLFDDTWPSASMNKYSGKGGTALRYLLKHGFELIEQSPPDQPSHLGWVLVRRLPEQQRPDLTQDDEATVNAVQNFNITLRILSPEEGALISQDPLKVDVGIYGVAEGEHALVVYSNGVEVLRSVSWPEPEKCVPDGIQGQCMNEIQGFSRFPLLLSGLERGPRQIMVQVIDSEHVVQTSEMVTVTVV